MPYNQQTPAIQDLHNLASLFLDHVREHVGGLNEPTGVPQGDSLVSKNIVPSAESTFNRRPRLSPILNNIERNRTYDTGLWLAKAFYDFNSKKQPDIKPGAIITSRKIKDGIVSTAFKKTVGEKLQEKKKDLVSSLLETVTSNIGSTIGDLARRIFSGRPLTTRGRKPSTPSRKGRKPGTPKKPSTPSRRGRKPGTPKKPSTPRSRTRKPSILKKLSTPRSRSQKPGTPKKPTLRSRTPSRATKAPRRPTRGVGKGIGSAGKALGKGMAMLGLALDTAESAYLLSSKEGRAELSKAAEGLDFRKNFFETLNEALFSPIKTITSVGVAVSEAIESTSRAVESGKNLKAAEARFKSYKETIKKYDLDGSGKLDTEEERLSFLRNEKKAGAIKKDGVLIPLDFRSRESSIISEEKLNQTGAPSIKQTPSSQPLGQQEVKPPTLANQANVLAKPSVSEQKTAVERIAPVAAVIAAQPTIVNNIAVNPAEVKVLPQVEGPQLISKAMQADKGMQLNLDDQNKIIAAQNSILSELLTTAKRQLDISQKQPGAIISKSQDSGSQTNLAAFNNAFSTDRQSSRSLLHSSPYTLNHTL